MHWFLAVAVVFVGAGAADFGESRVWGCLIAGIGL